MAKPRKKPPSQPPARQKVSYVAVPVEYGAILDALCADGEKYEGRSRAFLAKLAVRAFLQAEGKVDAKGKPIEGG